MVFASRAFDPNNGDVPSSQLGVLSMQYTDENWTKLREADKTNGWGLLRDAVRIFEKYNALSAA
jgi:hypothetical protein